MDSTGFTSRELNTNVLSKNEKKISKNKYYTDKWKKSGKTIPKCINKGCDKEVAIRHWSVQEDPSLKTECARCSNARIKGKTLPNIDFHKKNYCENKRPWPFCPQSNH